jgi:hypothetical protein
MRPRQEAVDAGTREQRVRTSVDRTSAILGSNMTTESGGRFKGSDVSVKHSPPI